MSVCKLFYIQNVCFNSWNNMMDKVMDSSLDSSLITYLLMCKQKRKKLVLGIIQHIPDHNSNIIDIMKEILNITDLNIWQESDYFHHLEHFPSIMYNFVTQEAKFIYEQYVQPQFVRPINKIQNVAKLDSDDISILFDATIEKSVMILVIEERLKGLPNQFRASCKIRGKKLCFHY